jgi:hypothetical protein
MRSQKIIFRDPYEVLDLDDMLEERNLIRTDVVACPITGWMPHS